VLQVDAGMAAKVDAIIQKPCSVLLRDRATLVSSSRYPSGIVIFFWLIVIAKSAKNATLA
jgi:hypothetical protein